MTFSFWSDEDRLFVSRHLGLGWSVNFKYIARKLGLIKNSPQPNSEDEKETAPGLKGGEDRLREQIEASKYEQERR